jgi:hypothetical protein
MALIERMVADCPRRQACSASERRAQQIVAAEFERLDLATEWREFRFSRDLYSVLALHFGVGTLGSLVARRAPLAGLALHLLAGGSYWADSTHRGQLLRRLRPAGRSQNLLATIAATAPIELRVVVAAHVDAALTGLMFRPEVVRRLHETPTPRWAAALDRPLAAVTHSQLLLAGLDAVQWLAGRPLRGTGWLRLALSLPGLLGLLLTTEIVHRDEVVPGASDDLSGVAAAVMLAQRLRGRLPPSVEMVFAITGAEEAGLGGARALAASGRWDPACTVVLGLDTLSGGELKYFEEGEIAPVPVPPWLEALVEKCAAAEPRFATIERFTVPVGHTDVFAFRRRGFDGLCLGAVDPSLGAPRNYHLPSDGPAELDPGELGLAIDFAEQLLLAIVEHRLAGRASRGAPRGALP